jgi:hypothetical protein
MRIRLVPVALLVVAALALAACGGDGTSTSTTQVPGKTPHVAINTGYAQLDAVLGGTLAGDTIDMAERTRYQSVACQPGATQDADAAPCRPDESAGSRVDAFPSVRCNDRWTRPEAVPDLYAAAIGTSPKLLAAYIPAPGAVRFGAQFVAVIQRGANQGAAVYVGDGKIVAVEEDCGNFTGLIAQDRVQSWIVQPGATPGGTPAATTAP